MSKVKMYVAVGLNTYDVECYGQPKTSPYMKTALVFFARSDREAQGHARKMLGHPSDFVRQLGRAEIDLARTKRNYDVPGLDPKIEQIHVMDQNDTNEGVTIVTHQE